MIEDHFVNAPTVGSHEQNTSVDELKARIHQLEQRIIVPEGKCTREKEKPPKITVGKVRRFFTTFISPILNFVPRFLNSFVRYKEAVRT